MSDNKKLKKNKVKKNEDNEKSNKNKIKKSQNNKNPFNENKKEDLNTKQKDSLSRSTSKNYSYYAIEWLEYIMYSTGENILHAKNGGEVYITDPEVKTKKTKKFKKYYFDGFCKETNTVYEFLGDFTHGRIKTIKDATNKLLSKKNEETFNRINRLKELGYKVIHMWSGIWTNSMERQNFVEGLINEFN